MSELNHTFWMQMAEHVSKQSKDPSTKVGCVIVKPDGFMIAAGFNHFARGLNNSPEMYLDRNEKYPRTVHAEMHALLTPHERVEGCALYSTLYPCEHCAKHIIDAGIAAVFSVLPEDMERWKASFELSTKLFKEAGVQVQVFPHWNADV